MHIHNIDKHAESVRCWLHNKLESVIKATDIFGSQSDWLQFAFLP